MRNSSSFSRSHRSHEGFFKKLVPAVLPAITWNLPWNPKEFGNVRSVCPITEPAIGAAGVTGPASSAAARATSWPVLQWASLSAFPLHCSGMGCVSYIDRRSSTYVGTTVTSFGISTYLSGRVCPCNMSLRELLWENRTSSSFSL